MRTWPLSRRSTAYVLVALSMFFFASNIVVGRFVRADIPPFGLTFWRTALAALLLLPVALPHLRRHRANIVDRWLVLLLLSLLLIVGGQALVYVAVQETTAISGSIIHVGQPVFAVFMAWLVLRDAITLVQFGGLIFSVLGVLCIATAGDLSLLMGLEFNVGDLWMVAAVWSFVFYSVLFKLWQTDVHPLALLQMLLVLGSLGLLPFYVFEMATGSFVEPSWNVVLIIAYLAVFVSVMAVITWNVAITTVGPGAASIFVSLYPVYSSLLSVMFLGESIFGFHIVGFACVFLGLVLTVINRPSKQDTEHPK